MLAEAREKFARVALVPIAAAGALAVESVVNTPVAEAGGCRDGRAITDTKDPQSKRELDLYCARVYRWDWLTGGAIRNEREGRETKVILPTEDNLLKTAAVCVSLAITAFFLGRTWELRTQKK